MSRAPAIRSLTGEEMAGVSKRHRAERRFRGSGLAAILLSVGFLVFFLIAILIRGYGAFLQSAIALDVTFDSAKIGLSAQPDAYEIFNASYRSMARAAMRDLAPEARSRREKRELYDLFGVTAEFELRDYLLDHPRALDRSARVWLTASDTIDLYLRGKLPADSPSLKLSERQVAWIDALRADGLVKIRFNWTFLTNSDSRDPEVAGVWGAIKGSAFALFICLILSFFVGSLAAVYLEEFARRNRWTDFLEININNLAAVPSITFGILGLAIFLNAFNLPRSAAFVGGLVLALMTLPTIIITSRVALQAVPPSIREAALGVGASQVQTVFHFVFPLALPGMLTGTIIGMARALGETAPLLMIGMVAFIADPPAGFFDPATALPVQVYLWADSPERAFAEKTAGAIIVLLVFLVLMNLLAVVLRKRFETKW